MIGRQYTIQVIDAVQDDACHFTFAGNDLLIGGAGEDTAVFSGAYADYSIIKNDGYATVKDKRENRDGMNKIIKIEFLQFNDRKVKL